MFFPPRSAHTTAGRAGCRHGGPLTAQSRLGRAIPWSDHLGSDAPAARLAQPLRRDHGDRARSPAPPPQRHRPTTPPRGRIVSTVSYTHLTLPTNREV